MAAFDPFNPLQNVKLRFTEEQLAEIIEYFDANAKPLLIIDDGAPVNVITVDKFIKFLELKKFHRRSFSYPTYDEIVKDAELLRAGVTRLLTKEQVIYMLEKRIREPEIRHELMLAFQVFDTEKRDFLEIDEIKTIVTSYGDVFNPDETRELLRDANVRGDGNIFYAEFIDCLFSRAPELYDIKAEYLYADPDEDPSVPPEPV
ncbi:uncharacterized protein [Choristoneura fumiferana]